MASLSTQKPSSSFSIPTPKWNFDVFLSFRGEDTRFTFTDHLFARLEERGIRTFRDQKLERGGEIEQQLLGTIEGSRLSIIVFSERYADSKWCLGELTKIMDCRKEMGQIVVPVFYHVDPSHLRKQSGGFGDAFARHETTVEEEKVKRWRAAMIEATKLAGWPVIKDNGYESKHIMEITDFIFKRLKPKLLPTEGHMVGIELRLEELKPIIDIHEDDIRVIGIYGIGGIGKTTIAKIVYNDILCQFSGGRFLEDVKNCHKDGLRLLQEVLGDGADDMIKYKLMSEKFLMVMDDVDKWEQLDPLIRRCKEFPQGSRVIITSRDKGLLDKMHGSFGVEVLLYEVNALSDKEAIQLFNWHTFKHEIPQKDYVNLSNRIVKYARGHPLALKVVGSSLCCKTIAEWKSELDKLKKHPKKEISDLFRISIDGLDYFQKEVLLDIACFFKGTNKDFVITILDSCDLYATCGMPVLLDRCLVTVVDNKIQMHDLIQQTVWAMVREEHPKDPSKWSRLWDPNDIEEAFSAKKMKNIETISLDWSRSKEIQFTSEVFAKIKHMFAKMRKLRLLKVYYNHDLRRKKDKVHLPMDFEFPRNLRYLHWEDLEFLPSNFDPKKLVAINLKSSNIKELWEENQCLEELKFIDLSDSQHLMKIPKLASMPNLERLNLGGCTSFYELRSSLVVFPRMKFLTKLNFSGSGIKELPSSIGSLPSLEILDLSFCLMFEKFVGTIFENMGHLRFLRLNGSGIRELPSSIGYLESLESLELRKCRKFEKFSEIHGSMKSLSILELNGTPIKELPTGIGCLGALEYLSIRDCSKLDKLPEFQRNMGRLREIDARESAIKELPSSICHLTQLKILSLKRCKNITSFPSIICKLKSLKECYLAGCSDMKAFLEITEDVEHFEKLDLRGTGITELPSSIEHWKSLTYLQLSNCENLETLPNSISNLKNLTHLFLQNCSKFHKLPDSIGNLKNLTYLFLQDCSKFHKLPDGLRSLNCCLKHLDMSGCNLMEGAIPSDVWGLFSLEFLDLSGNNNIRGIPVGIIHISHLKTLYMNHCHKLKEIPELPSSLRRICALDCPCLETISSDSTHVFWSSLLNCFKSKIQDLCNEVYMLSSDIDVVILRSICGGNGIPEWVSHRSMGSDKIVIELPKNWYNDTNFLGFAFFSHCIPIPLGHHFSHSSHCVILNIYDGYQFQFVKTIHEHGHCNRFKANRLEDWGDFVYAPNPALMVAYFPQIAIEREYRSNGWNKFQACFEGVYRCGHHKTVYKVESCGIHLIYGEHEPQPFNLKRIHRLIDVDNHPLLHKRSRQV